MSENQGGLHDARPPAKTTASLIDRLVKLNRIIAQDPHHIHKQAAIIEAHHVLEQLYMRNMKIK